MQSAPIFRRALQFLKFTAVLAFLLLLTAASLTITGHLYGVNNSVFHIPYVLNLAETPEFSDDAFYATLKYFASIVYPIMRLFATDDNVQAVFAVASFVSRFGALAGLLYLAMSNGLRSRLGLVLFMVGVVVSPWFQDFSVVGGHGMFLYYFTHSEVTWPLVFVALALLASDRLVPAAAAIGLMASINIFVAIWLGLVGAFAVLTSRRPLDFSTAAKSLAMFLVFASPVVIWLVVSLFTGNARGAAPFSFVGYVREYHSEHFLIEATPRRALMHFALMSVCGLMAASYVSNSRFWLRIQVGCLLIFVVGVVLPYFVDSRLVINLHLVRSAGLEQAVAGALVILAGARLALYADSYRGRLLGLTVLFATCALERTTGSIIIVALTLLVSIVTDPRVGSRSMAIVGFAERYAKSMTAVCVTLVIVELTRRFLGPDGSLQLVVVLFAFVLCILLALPGGEAVVLRRGLLASTVVALAASFVYKSIPLPAYEYRYNILDAGELNKSWTEIERQIRNSEIAGPFLIPVDDRRGFYFQLRARRKVWVDWKQGAAVMWAPSFYEQWARRYKEVSALGTPESFIDYARSNNIKNVLIHSTAGVCPAPASLKLRTAHLVLCVL